ncbi:MAG: PAS domain-containing protein [Betaproteobacteria bacterium]|nr:PAS domain-containing protein [Betaproteobacteria bacterium]MBI3056198.1 PAS domain-containing protein [Betaproteobacteria bacterium]
MIRPRMRLREIAELLANTSDPSFAVDGSACIAAWNSAAEAMFALSARDAIGRRCNEVVQGTDECGPVCSADCIIHQAVGKHHPGGSFDLQVQAANGIQWCNVTVLIADGENSTTRYAIHVVRPIDFRKRLDLLVRDLLVREFVVAGTGLPGEPATTPIVLKPPPTRENILSPRECDVLKLLAKGATTTAVAEQFRISRTTVNNHVRHILRKLNSHTRLEAIRRAEHDGLI